MKKTIAGLLAAAVATFAQADVIELFAATPVTCTKDPAATAACDYSYASDFSLVYASKSVALYCWNAAPITLTGPDGVIVDNVLNINDTGVAGFSTWKLGTAWNSPASLGASAAAAYGGVADQTVDVVAYGWNFLQFDLVDQGGVYANSQLWLEAPYCTIQPKLKICHKGKTITIANDAVKAHVDHGDAVSSIDVGCN